MAVNTDRLIITSLDEMRCFNNAGELEFIMDELQDTTISNAQENVDITGRNGAIIAQLKRNKSVTITGNNGFLVGGGLAAQTGAEVEQGTFNIRVSEVLTVKSNAVTMEGDPVGDPGAEIIALYKRNENGSMGTKFEQDATASVGKFEYSDKTITFSSGELQDGDQVVVIYDRETEAAKIVNDSKRYSKTLRMYIDATAKDNCDNEYHVQIQIPRADFSGEFDIAMGSEATSHAWSVSCLADTCSGSGNLWEFYVFE